MISNVVFRKVEPDDWSKFRVIRLAGLKSDPQAFGGSFDEEVARQESEWRKRLAMTDRFFFAAEVSGVFVSIAGAKQIGEKVWMLVAVHTLPESRGKGYAQELTKLILEEAKVRGAVDMQLMVNVDQENAVHIYKKTGFTITKTLPAEKMGDGKLHDEYLMEKKL